MRIRATDTMSLKGILTAFVLVVGAILGAVGNHALAQDAAGAPLVQEELVRQQLESELGPRTLWVRRVELAPGASLAEAPEIEHPAAEFVYVLEGSAILTEEGGDAVTFEPGESWRNEFEQAHTLENASSSEPAVLLVVWVGAEGDF